MVTITEIYDYVVQALNESQFAQGAVVMGLLTGLWQIIRTWPKNIWPRIRRLMLYSTTVEQSDELYILLAQWIALNHSPKLRNTEAFLKETYANESYNNEAPIDTSESNFNKEAKVDVVKYRQHNDYIIIWYKSNFIKIDKGREKLDAASSLIMAYLGRIELSGFFAKKQIELILEEAKNLRKIEKTKINKYIWDEYNWSREDVLTFKTVDNIFFPKKQSILNRVSKFEESIVTYKKRGIEWYLGILLYGPPGSGKTAFAKALSHFTKRSLHVANLASMSDKSLVKAFLRMSNGSILLLDDVDVCIPTREVDISKSGDGVTLSTLLSCLDGANSRSDLIVIMTTNHINKLDPALTRRGRMDIVELIDYPDKESVEAYVSNFYDISIKLLDGLTYDKPMVNIQDICLRSNNWQDAVYMINNKFKVKINGKKVYEITKEN